MTKEQIQSVMNSVDAANPGLRLSNRFAWTEKVALECYKTDKTVGQKRADMGRPVSDDTIGWMKAGPAMNGTPGQAIKTPMTAVDLLDGSTGAMHFNEIPLLTGAIQYFVIPPASGESASVGPVYPPYEALGGDEAGVKISQAMEADYKRAGRPGLDGGCGAWMQRTVYDFVTGVCATPEESIEKHRAEWCEELGIPVS